MSPKKGNIRLNLPWQKDMKHTIPNIRADEISKKKSTESRTATTGAGPGWLVYVRTPYLATQWYRISVRMEGAGLFENFINFVRIGSWPFSKFRQNPSGLLPSLPYHWLGSSQRSETAPGSPFISPWRCEDLSESLLAVTGHRPVVRKQNFGQMVTGHTPVRIDWNGTVDTTWKEISFYVV